MGAVLDAAILRPEAEVQFLAEVTAGREYNYWTTVTAPAGGYGLKWSGTTGSSFGYVYAPSAASLDLTSDLTLEVWIEYGGETNSGVICKGTGSGAYSLILAGRPIFRLNKGALSLDAWGVTLIPGTTYHIAATYDQTNGMARIWVDGSLVATGSFDADVITNAEPLYVGNYWNMNYGLTASTVYEVRVSSVCRYTSAFTPTEGWTTDVDTTLLWGLASGTYPVVDSSANGNDGLASASDAPTFEAVGTEVSYYRTPETEALTAVYADGVALTAESDLTTGFGWNTDGTYLNVRLASDVSPYTKTMLGMIPFFFSKRGLVLNNRFYDGRITEVPRLSKRLEANFNGVGQVGSSSITFTNRDGFFDDYLDLHWDAGTTRFLVGIDLPAIGDTAAYQMPYSEYVAMATWVNSAPKLDGGKFSLSLLEGKSKLKKKIPFGTYTRDEYPNLADDGVGAAKQIAYGVIYGATPICIDTEAKRFKLADHAIHSLQDVRMNSSESSSSVAVTYTAADLLLGEFTVPSWDGSSSIYVDFTGKPLANGRPMDNAADQVSDLLTTLGETNQNAASFAAAKEALTVGYYGTDTAAVASVRCPGIYIADRTDAFDVFSQINKAVFSYLYCNAAGEYTYTVFSPAVGEGTPVFTDEDIKRGTFSISWGEDSDYSEAIAHYAERLSEGWSQTASYAVTANQYTKNEPMPVVYEESDCLPFSKTSEALYWVERVLVHMGLTPMKYTFITKHRGFTLNIGDFITLIYSEKNLNGVFEVLELEKDISKGDVKVTVGNMHGFGNRTGFWVNSTDTLPARFAAETGYGTGTLTWNDSWSDTIKAWVKQNVGFWVGAQNLVSATDGDSKHSVWL